MSWFAFHTIRVLCFIKSAIPCSLATRVNSHVNPKLMRSIRVWQWRWMNSKSKNLLEVTGRSLKKRMAMWEEEDIAHVFKSKFPVNYSYRASSKMHFKLPENFKPILWNESIVSLWRKRHFFQNAHNRWRGFPPDGLFMNRLWGKRKYMAGKRGVEKLWAQSFSNGGLTQSLPRPSYLDIPQNLRRARPEFLATLTFWHHPSLGEGDISEFYPSCIPTVSCSYPDSWWLSSVLFNGEITTFDGWLHTWTRKTSPLVLRSWLHVWGLLSSCLTSSKPLASPRFARLGNFHPQKRDFKQNMWNFNQEKTIGFHLWNWVFKEPNMVSSMEVKFFFELTNV